VARSWLTRSSEHIWRREDSRASRVALAPLRPIAGLYALGARLHRMAYQSGFARASRLSAKVVSVGNVAAGGSGKTPLVAWLAAQLHARGWRVAVLSRGVGGTRARRVNVVSDGTRVFLGAADVGDEPVWLARAVPGVAVLAGVNRTALGLRATSALGAEIVILDDGFQHHRLERDLDLVCLEASLGLGNRYTLPRGPLREPASVLRYADALLITRIRPELAGREAADRDLEEPSGGRHAGAIARLPRFRFAVEPTRLRSLSSGAERSLAALSGVDVGVLTAIARPERLCRDLEARGARVVEVCAFSDHHMFRRAEIARLNRGLRWITSGKDAVKIPPEWASGHSIEIVEERLDELGPPKLVEWVLEQLELGGA